MSLVAFVIALVGGVDGSLEEHAKQMASNLMKAADAYALSPANKQGLYPSTVGDLLMPPGTKEPGAYYLKNKEKDLMDPWGAIFRCRTERDDRGNPRFYVWTERFVNGKVRKIGFPPPEKK